MNKAKPISNSKNFITYKIPSYDEAVKTASNQSTNIPVSSIFIDTKNNLIYSFNKHLNLCINLKSL